MKYIIYCRKSTDSEDRQVQSLESQEKELLKLAESQGLQVIGTMNESMSAKAEGRPVFNRVLGMLSKGEADGIICWKLDRLARNFIDGGKIIDLLQKSSIKEIRTNEGIYLPTDNVLMIAMHFGMANQYIRDLSVNVKRGNREKLSRGGWPGRAPFGYLNDKATKLIVPDSSKSHFVKRIYELYANDGKSYGEVSDILYQEGLRTSLGRKVLKGTINKIISSKFYVGLMERDGKLHQGVHQPLITKELYDLAQVVSDNKSRPRSKTLFFPLRGYLKCDVCGCSFTASLKRGHDYYYCTNGKQICNEHTAYLRENYLYEKIADSLGSLAFSPRKVELAYKASLEKLGHLNKYHERASEALQNELKMLIEKESRLFDVYLAGDMDKPLYEEKLKELKNRRVELSNQISKQNTVDPKITLEQIKNVFSLGITMRNKFLEASDEKKKEIMQNVLWNISIKGKETFTVQYKSPYNILANSPKNLSISQLLGYWYDIRTILSKNNEFDFVSIKV